MSNVNQFNFNIFIIITFLAALCCRTKVCGAWKHEKCFFSQARKIYRQAFFIRYEYLKNCFHFIESRWECNITRVNCFKIELLGIKWLIESAKRLLQRFNHSLIARTLKANLTVIRRKNMNFKQFLNSYFLTFSARCILRQWLQTCQQFVIKLSNAIIH